MYRNGLKDRKYNEFTNKPKQKRTEPRFNTHYPGCTRQENTFPNYAPRRKPFPKQHDAVTDQTAKRKLGYILSSMSRYYGIRGVQIAIDHKTSLVSTEVGILHHLFGTMLPQRHAVAPSACVADCMCGLGTMAMCAYLHSDGGRIFAMDTSAAAVRLARANLQALVPYKGKNAMLASAAADSVAAGLVCGESPAAAGLAAESSAAPLAAEPVCGESPAGAGLAAESPAALASAESSAALVTAENLAALATAESPAALATAESPAALVTTESPAALATTESPAALATAESPAAPSTPESPAASMCTEDEVASISSASEDGEALSLASTSGEDNLEPCGANPEQPERRETTARYSKAKSNEPRPAELIASDAASFTVLEASHTEFLASQDSHLVNVIVLSASWERENERSPELLLSQLNGLVRQESHAKLQTIVLKIAPGWPIRVQDVGFARKATQYAMQFYGRHSFDFLILDGPWHTGSSAMLTHLAEPVRSAARCPAAWQLVRSVPYTGMVPPGVSMPDASKKRIDYASAINYKLQDSRTGIYDPLAPDPWRGKTPDGMHVHVLDIECFAQARQQAPALFAELVRMQATGLQRGLGFSKWPSTASKFPVSECKAMLSRHYNYLYNIVTDVEHFVRSTLARSQHDLERCATVQFVHLERGTGIPLHLPPLHSDRDVVFIMPLERMFALDFTPCLVPGEVNGPGYHLRTTLTRGSIVHLQNEASSLWAHGVPFGSPYEQYLLLYTVHEDY